VSDRSISFANLANEEAQRYASYGWGKHWGGWSKLFPFFGVKNVQVDAESGNRIAPQLPFENRQEQSPIERNDEGFHGQTADGYFDHSSRMLQFVGSAAGAQVR
jgi:hypothetical protein